MPTKRSHRGLPKLFIASEVENLDIVHRIQKRLQKNAEITVWTEDVFTLSQNPLPAFQRVLENADCALFIAGSFDGRRNTSSNLVLELGISISYLGSERTAIFLLGSTPPPTDVRTIREFRYKDSRSREKLLVSGLASLAVSLRKWIRDVGRRKSRSTARAQPGELIPTTFKSTQRKARKKSPATSVRRGRNSVFISYARSDSKWLARISTMLTPLVRSNDMSVWDDTQIKPGKKWREEIKRALASARVALLLVSPSFLASGFIAGDELPPILKAAEGKGLVLVWALISPCLWRKTPLVEYQAALSTARPLDSLVPSKRNQALLVIAETVGAALETSKR